MRIHLVQNEIHWQERDRNIECFLALAEGVTPSAGDLVVFPELFGSGFSMEPERFAESIPDASPTLDALKAWAAKRGAAVVGGIAITDGTTFANEAVAALPDGTVARYQKHQGFSLSGECGVYRGGDRLTSFSWGGGNIGLTICYDLRFPEIYRALAFSGSELLVNIANWPARRIDHWVKLLQARAIENQCYVAGVNRIGEDPNASYVGRSLVVDPHGEIIAGASDRACVASAEINFETVRSWRKNFPALGDARRDNPPVDHIG